MFGLVTQKEYDRLAGDYENDRWWWEKQVHALEERVTEGEKYRDELEKKNAGLLEDNRRMFESKSELYSKVGALEAKNREYELKIMSLESRWVAKANESGDDS